MTADGKIACDSGASQWVTGKEARQHVQESRNALTGIMVGINTVLMDDPQLTCHLEQGCDPVRIVCDSHLQIPLESKPDTDSKRKFRLSLLHCRMMQKKLLSYRKKAYRFL